MRRHCSDAKIKAGQYEILAEDQRKIVNASNNSSHVPLIIEKLMLSPSYVVSPSYVA